MTDHIKDVIVFLASYLTLALIPFLILNREVLDDIEVFIAQDVLTVAVLGTGALIAIAGLFVGREGVQRYNNFLEAPTDLMSMFVTSMFVIAAFSWWLVPELAFYFEWSVGIEELIVMILIFHLPMILFLSLMTAIGKA